jgi:hypothetical protein
VSARTEPRMGDGIQDHLFDRVGFIEGHSLPNQSEMPLIREVRIWSREV